MNRIALLFILMPCFIFPQTKSGALKKTEFERYEEADGDFRMLMDKTEDPTLLYFYGNNFICQDQADSALKYYRRGKNLAPNEPLYFVGLGKLALQEGHRDEADRYFQSALSLANGKRPDVNRELAKAYLDFEIKEPDKAIAQIELAIKAEPKNSVNYIILGDAQLERDPTSGSLPIKSYKKASALNPHSTLGILKEGKLYQRGRNYQLALQKYNEAIALDSNFAVAYRELAELYSLVRQPKRSVEYWKKYLRLNNSNFAHYRFLSALFSDKQYSEVVQEYGWLKSQGYSNLFCERLAAYSYYEIGDKADTDAYAKGLIAMMRFFDMAGDSFNYISSDYKYKGLLLLKNGNSRLGREAIKRAIEIDSTTEGEVRAEVASICMDEKNYECVITQLTLKSEAKNSGLSTSELFDLGRAYYFSAMELTNVKPVDTLYNKKYLSKLNHADSTFQSLNARTPNWPYGFLWRARSNVLLDPNVQSDTAKVLYERVATLLEQEGKVTSTYLIEAYEYLGYYYVTKKDKTNADIIWTKVKTLQPDNKKQKDYFKFSRAKK